MDKIKSNSICINAITAIATSIYIIGSMLIVGLISPTFVFAKPIKPINDLLLNYLNITSNELLLALVFSMAPIGLISYLLTKE